MVRKSKELIDQDMALLDNLRRSIVDRDNERAVAISHEVIKKGIPPLMAIEQAIGQASKEVGELFDKGEIFLPHLVMAGDTMIEVTKVLESAIPKSDLKKKVGIVIGTVKADIHSIGKNIVLTMLRANGFTIYDLGVDVDSVTFIQKAEEVNAEIIALSSLLTTTMIHQKDLIEELVATKKREKFKVLVGGGPVTQSWAEEIGADGWGEDAMGAVVMAKKLTGLKT